MAPQISHSGIFFLGLWALGLAVVADYATRFISSNARLTCYIRIFSGIGWGCIVFECIFYALTGTNVLTVVMTVAFLLALCAYIPLTLYAMIRYPRPTEVRWTLKAIWRQYRSREKW